MATSRSRSTGRRREDDEEYEDDDEEERPRRRRTSGHKVTILEGLDADEVLDRLFGTGDDDDEERPKRRRYFKDAR